MNIKHLWTLLPALPLLCAASGGYAQDIFDTQSTTRSYNFFDIRKGVKNTADENLWLTFQYDLRDNFSLVAEYLGAADSATVQLEGVQTELGIENIGFTIGASYRNTLINTKSTDWMIWLLYGRLEQDFEFDRGEQFPLVGVTRTTDLIELFLGLRHSLHPRIEVDAGARVTWVEELDVDTLEGTGQIANNESFEAQLVYQATDHIGLSLVARDITATTPLYFAGIRYSW